MGHIHQITGRSHVYSVIQEMCHPHHHTASTHPHSSLHFTPTLIQPEGCPRCCHFSHHSFPFSAVSDVYLIVDRPYVQKLPPRSRFPLPVYQRIIELAANGTTPSHLRRPSLIIVYVSDVSILTTLRGDKSSGNTGKVPSQGGSRISGGSTLYACHIYVPLGGRIDACQKWSDKISTWSSYTGSLL